MNSRRSTLLLLDKIQRDWTAASLTPYLSPEVLGKSVFRIHLSISPSPRRGHGRSQPHRVRHQSARVALSAHTQKHPGAKREHRQAPQSLRRGRLLLRQHLTKHEPRISQRRAPKTGSASSLLLYNASFLISPMSLLQAPMLPSTNSRKRLTVSPILTYITDQTATLTH